MVGGCDGGICSPRCATGGGGDTELLLHWGGGDGAEYHSVSIQQLVDDDAVAVPRTNCLGHP